MLLLAIVAVSGMALARQAGMLPRRADFARVVLAAALTGGGVGYLLPNPALAWMALLALPLLLIWVAGMGVWLSVDPAASQMTGSARQTRNPVKNLAAATARPGTWRASRRRRRLGGPG